MFLLCSKLVFCSTFVKFQKKRLESCVSGGGGAFQPRSLADKLPIGVRERRGGNSLVIRRPDRGSKALKCGEIMRIMSRFCV